LSPRQRNELQEDLDLAARIQTGLLPPKQFRTDVWTAAYRYSPLGAVSGDYCDLLPGGDGAFLFALGDVSGKGVAASMLMAHLHASIRVLMGSGLGVEEMVKRASRVFCESTLPSHYVTLICGHCHPDGRLELVNAGHVPPMLVRRDGVFPLEATGLPIGLFCQEEFQVRRLTLEPGDALLIYTDGLTEVSDGREEFGRARLADVLAGAAGSSGEELVLHCLRAADAFRGRLPFTDDLTVLAIRKE
jgi:sigma-B regulation protein RsbU (phosphoserine phosphatase)